MVKWAKQWDRACMVAQSLQLYTMEPVSPTPYYRDYVPNRASDATWHHFLKDELDRKESLYETRGAK